METRRRFLQYAIAMLAGLSACSQSGRPLANAIPVIVDTDIGDDIDDTWALLMLLRMPQFDVKLAVGDFGESTGTDISITGLQVFE